MPPKPKKKVVQDTIKPTYRNIGNANFASSQKVATKTDSLDYAQGFKIGMNNMPPKTQAQRRKMYPNASSYFTQGRYEAQNNPGSLAKRPKNTGSETTFIQKVQSFFNFD